MIEGRDKDENLQAFVKNLNSMIETKKAENESLLKEKEALVSEVKSKEEQILVIKDSQIEHNLYDVKKDQEYMKLQDTLNEKQESMEKLQHQLIQSKEEISQLSQKYESV